MARSPTVSRSDQERKGRLTAHPPVTGGWRVLRFLTCLVVACVLPLRLQATVTEADLKAVFIFRCTQFVEWPADAYGGEGEPFVIGVLGTNPFGSLLEEVVAGEKFQGRRIVVRFYDRVEDALESQILYISSSEEKRISEIFSKLDGRPILTIGDMEGFATRGGMIRFMAGSKGRLSSDPGLF
jgi:hypothetical protein